MKKKAYFSVFSIFSVLVLLALLAGCDDNGPSTTYVPPDTWTVIDSDGTVFGETTIRSVGYGGGKFVAGGAGGKIWHSTDGVTWTAASDVSAFGSSADNAIRGICYGNGVFLAVDGASRGLKNWAKSTDGDTWNKVTPETNSFNAIGVAYGAGKFLAGGQGKIAYSANPASDAWEFLTDEEVTFNGNGNNFINAITFGGGKFVSAGSNYGHTAYSTDGVAWQSNSQTEEIFGSGTFLNGAAYGNGTFVVVGEGGGIAAWSKDGVNWTQAVPKVGADDDNKFGEELLCAAYGGGYFVVGGKNGSVFYSKDGAVWKKVAQALGDDPINGVAYGGGKFVIVGQNGKAAYMVVEQ